MEALLASHLFCFPSRTEQFPVAILEAMACGLAIVATRVGGSRTPSSRVKEDGSSLPTRARSSQAQFTKLSTI